MASAWNEAWTQNLSQQADPSTASPGEEHRALGGEREVKEGASEAGAPKVRCTQENIKPGGPRQSQKPRCGPCQGSTWRAAGGTGGLHGPGQPHGKGLTREGGREGRSPAGSSEQAQASSSVLW